MLLHLLLLLQAPPIEFTSVYTVRGRVMVKGHGPAVRAHVTACNADGWTDSQGLFSLGGSVRAGGYLGCTVSIQLPGTQAAQIPIAAPAGSIDLGEIILTPLAEGIETGTVSFLSLQAPPTAQKIKQQARKKLERQDAKGAQKDLERALKLYETDPEAWLGLGLAQARQNQAPAAKQSWEKALEVDPRFTPPRIELARQALEEKQRESALHHCKAALERNPAGLPLAHLFSAMAYLNLGRFEDAATSARSALETGGPAKAHHVLGVALVKLNQAEAGIAEMEKFLKLSPNAPEAALVSQQVAAIQAK